MAAGDTVQGQIRVMKNMVLGGSKLVLGPFSQSQVDHKDALEKGLFVNVPREALPIGSMPAYSKLGVFESGEVLDIQHKATALAEAIDYEDDEFFISIIEEDLNTKDKAPRTLTVADTELAADPTTSTSAWVTIFKDTVPDRRRWYLAGSFNVAATETA